jgi:uncharacterized membrane protein YfcA
MFTKLPFHKAMGTTLLVIAVNSLFGFMGDLSNYQMDWQLLIIFSALSIAVFSWVLHFLLKFLVTS